MYFLHTAIETVIIISTLCLLAAARPAHLKNDVDKNDLKRAAESKNRDENKISLHDGSPQLRTRKEFNILFAEPKSESSDTERLAAGRDKISAIKAAAIVANILRADFERFSEMQAEPDRLGMEKPNRFEAPFEMEPIFVRMEPNSEARNGEMTGLETNNQPEQKPDLKNYQNGDDMGKKADYDGELEMESDSSDLEPNMEQTEMATGKIRSNQTTRVESPTAFGKAYKPEPNFTQHETEQPNFDTAYEIDNAKQPDSISARTYEDQTLFRGRRHCNHLPRDIIEGAYVVTTSTQAAEINHSNTGKYLLNITLPTFIGFILLVLLCLCCVRGVTNLCHQCDDTDRRFGKVYLQDPDLKHESRVYRKSLMT